MVGAGAIGGFVAARLTMAGWPVTAMARGATFRALASGPLRLLDDGEERSVRLDVVDDPVSAGPFELAVVTVKSHDTEAASARLAAAADPGATVLSLQNGVHNAAVLRRALPEAHVGSVAVYLGCQRTAPDRVVRRPSRDPATGRPRDRLVGSASPPCGPMLEAVGGASGVAVELAERTDVAMWTKLVANVALNTVTALGRARVGAVFADPAAVRLMLDLGEEVEAVARASGVPLPAGSARAYVADARRRLPAAGGSSTLFDLDAGRRLERDALVGSVARDGERLGVPVPVSRSCAALLGLLDPPPDPG